MAREFMDMFMMILYIVLFIIMMVFVFSIGMLKKFIPKKEVILILVVAFLIGAIGGAFFLDPIYDELPYMVSSVEKNLPDNEEVLYLDLSSSTDMNELEQNLSGTPGFIDFKVSNITFNLWRFSDREKEYFNYVLGNIDPHYKNFTVYDSGRIDIELEDNYSASSALKSFSDWYKLVYGGSINYAQIHAQLTVSSTELDVFQQNLMDRGIVASKMEGPVQDSIDKTNASMLSNTEFTIATGLVGVVVSILGIYCDTLVVGYRRFRKFLREKRKR